ncbi:hypothetical protein K2173_011913 [Erythroxylum novogranatense]|uniref:BHLH domain-containing protein n=1 Tax=Erythroxylum novogranatense TaxID=1862640 RepID=A0AAV8TG43_9ROSI|nr:hypothetical protein K2173_011913 [Erythroxylum novogranatense]
MIQDSVKELREIVPNGAKCSIDALLERTIKHMPFLQSVIKHAVKLKPTGESKVWMEYPVMSKIISNEGGVLLKDNFDGVATWAFEVGSQSMVCPIVVEDLNPPCQMLVEMLCEESGFFLEIADLIRGLGLWKIWARFAVEANRDITRMEIFMSLVRLLEQTVTGNTTSTMALETNPLMGIMHSLKLHQSLQLTKENVVNSSPKRCTPDREARHFFFMQTRNIHHRCNTTILSLSIIVKLIMMKYKRLQRSPKKRSNFK